MGINIYLRIGTFLLFFTLSSAAMVRKLRQGEACPTEGFFRDEMDCGKFYRCVTLPPGLHTDSTSTIGRYEFQCPAGTVFDGRFSTCNYPNQIDQTDSCANVVPPPPATIIDGSGMPTPGQVSPILPADGSYPVLSPSGSLFYNLYIPQQQFGYRQNQLPYF